MGRKMRDRCFRESTEHFPLGRLGVNQKIPTNHLPDGFSFLHRVVKAPISARIANDKCRATRAMRMLPPCKHAEGRDCDDWNGLSKLVSPAGAESQNRPGN